MPVKRMICLANSRKLSGRCIAGKEFSGACAGGWIRPVSAREHEEVSEHERQYSDGTDPRVMDVIDVPLLSPRPHGYQQENWLLDTESYWVRAGRIDWADLGRLSDPPAPLWIDGMHTYNGLNDKIPLDQVAGIRDSLRLIHVPRMTLLVCKPGAAFGNPKRRVQGRFDFCDNQYHLWLTDPVYERAYLAQPDGEYPLGECYLTISLGEPLDDVCYKLIAAIIEPGGGRRT